MTIQLPSGILVTNLVVFITYDSQGKCFLGRISDVGVQEKGPTVAKVLIKLAEKLKKLQVLGQEP